MASTTNNGRASGYRLAAQTSLPPVGAQRLIARVSGWRATFELAGHNAGGEALYTVRFEPLPVLAPIEREGC